MSEWSSRQQPRSITVAFWLFLLAALVQLVVLVVSLSTAGGSITAGREQVAKVADGVGTSQAQLFVGPAIVVGIVIGGLVMIAFIVFDMLMRRGKPWARVVLTVVTVFSLSTAGSLHGLGIIGLLAAVAATVLIFLKPSNAFFAS
ncbi:hypothetical protein [Frondihabitans sp. PAMC 28766]|uniref:hypothetical protein n=1 Tax=Frondihabitans sp. PAMC 28766 TaxID=1795630 RepID=UPI0012FF78BD|nr:hypothetical protein [Frondihabitans sp. PAMC 28766]